MGNGNNPLTNKNMLSPNSRPNKNRLNEKYNHDPLRKNPTSSHIICDWILENHQSMHNRTFVINHNWKQRVKMQASKNYVGFYCLAGRWIHTPMERSWASMCLHVHTECKDLVLFPYSVNFVSYIRLFTLRWQRNLQWFFWWICLSFGPH